MQRDVCKTVDSAAGLLSPIFSPGTRHVVRPSDIFVSTPRIHSLYYSRGQAKSTI